MECPWCYKEVTVQNGPCPECGQEIYELRAAQADPSHGETEGFGESDGQPSEESWEDASLEHLISARFKCAKCAGQDCIIEEGAMTGTGLSKLLDIQHKHYLFVSCTGCGYVEVYDPNILRGKTVGRLTTVLDLLFGG